MSENRLQLLISQKTSSSYLKLAEILSAD